MAGHTFYAVLLSGIPRWNKNQVVRVHLALLALVVSAIGDHAPAATSLELEIRGMYSPLMTDDELRRRRMLLTGLYTRCKSSQSGWELLHLVEF